MQETHTVLSFNLSERRLSQFSVKLFVNFGSPNTVNTMDLDCE